MSQQIVLGALFLYFLSVTVPADGAQSSYSVKNAMPNLHITSFAQDGSGYVWIGTAKGLCRYNGYEYFCYTHDPADPRTIPSDLITSLFVDSDGYLWVSTEKGVCTYNFNSDDFTRYRYPDGETSATPLEYQCIEYGGEIFVCGVNGVKKADKNCMAFLRIEGSPAFTVSSIAWDDFAGLWVGGQRSEGIWYMAGGEAVNVISDPGIEYSCAYKTPSGDIWFGSNRGITAINPITKKRIVSGIETKYPEIADKLNVKFITELENHRILIGTENYGAFVYDFSGGTLIPFDETDFVVEVNSVHFTACYIDNRGNTWLGTFDKGYFIELKRYARFNTDKRFNNLFADKFVTRIAEDADGNFWIGTRYNGFHWYDSRTRTLRSYNSDNFGPLMDSGTNLIEELLIDSQGNLWLGAVKALIKCTVDNGEITAFEQVPGIAPATMIEDSRGDIRIGSSMNGLYIAPQGDIGNLFSIPLIHKWNNVTTIAEGTDGRIYFALYGDGIYYLAPDREEVRPLELNSHIYDRQERIISMYIDSRNILWAGTYGGGLIKYDIEDSSYESFTVTDGLPDRNVVAITGDYQGNIWMSTSYGLSKLDRDTGNISVFFDDDGIGGNQFHEKSVLRSQNGKIYFGGNHGLTYFDSREISQRDYDIPVILEDLRVMNESEHIGKTGGILQSHISKQDAIVLTHKHTTFNIDFAAIDFGSSKKIRYAYRLSNFDREWNFTSDYRRATYSNLKPGRYTFEVMAQNYNGTWSHAPTMLAVRILPSPWLKPGAVVAYVLMAVLLLWAAVRIYIKIRMSNEKLALVEKENENHKEMTSMKIRFFTNISHELRTPVTMIYGPVKKLLQGDTDEETRDYLLNLLNFNVNNLLRLIDQLMDFARLESDTLALAITQVDPMPLIRNLVNSHNFFAREKNITLELVSPEDPGEIHIDADKLSKIVSNLLSNALKYTPENGHITVSVSHRVSEEGGHLVVVVRDDGIGMKSEDLKHLFKRYKRFGSRDDYSKNTDGKGIGLNYVKRLVEIHRGTIEATLNDSKGMTFTVSLPTDKDYYLDQPADIVPGGTPPEPHHGDGDPELKPETGSGEPYGEDRKIILVVEDDAELNKFITTLLRDEFTILSAGDGIEGMEICRQFNVGVIISDVLMPRMDGYEFCRNVKKDPELCHIPFVMLTAKAREEDQLEGYEYGADNYINKPFNPDILKYIIKNTFLGIEKRRNYILKSLSAGMEGTAPAENVCAEPVMAPLDKKFLEKLYDCIEKDITNTNLNINELSSRMAFSRTSFYRKVRALTGLSPNELLKVYRLEKAVKLMETDDYTISEVVDLTGFGTHSHFSTTFKKHFGINPKRYKGRK